MTKEQIQLHVLALAINGDVFRRDVVKALNVKPAEVDAAIESCKLLKRVTANNGAHVRYRFVD